MMGVPLFHVEIAGPVANIHKLSSWVVVFFFPPFLFAIKYTVLTMYNRSLRSASNLATPIKKKKKTGYRIINKESVTIHLYKAGELSSKRIYIGKIPKAIKRDKHKRVYTPNSEAKPVPKPTC